MREFIEQLINRIRQFWEQLDLTRRLILLGSVLALVLLVIFAVFWFGKGDFVTLYAELNREDLATSKLALKRNGIEYKINERYNEILVPIDKYDSAQILIAERGTISGNASAFGSKTYQRTPSGYEILERGSLSLMSDNEFAEFRRQALEGEIAHTLASFDGVRSAKVGMALPKHEIFVKDKREPRVSVLLELEPDRFGSKFDPQVIPIMQKIVAYRVPDLKPENVQIADTEGLYDSSELAEKDTAGDEMLKQLEIEKKYEDRFKQKVRQALGIYGDRIASVEVRVKVDLNQKNILEEEFTPVTEDGKGLQRSSLDERESFEGSGILPGGVPGVSSNVPPEYMGTEAVGPSTYDRSKRIDNYEMNRKVTEEMTQPTYEIVSASVLIDLSLQQQIKSISNLISKTLNITDEKIAIEATSFPVKAVQALKEAQPIWFRLIEMALITLTVIAILLFLRSMLRRREVVETSPVDEVGIPDGMTVREYVDQQLEERVSLFERERAEQEEIDKELEIARIEAEEEEAKRIEEEEAKRIEEEEAKRIEKEAKEKIKTEAERRKAVLDAIIEAVQENPEIIAEVLQMWLQQPEETSDESEQTTEETTNGDGNL